MKLTNREKVYLALAGVAVLGYLYFQFDYKPESAKIKQLKEEYNQKTLLMQRVNGGKARLDAIKKDTEALDKELAKKKGKLSQSIRVPEILSELDSVAEKNNISISNIGFEGDTAAVKGKLAAMGGSPDAMGENTQQQATSQAAVGGKLQTIIVRFDFTGKYKDYLDFMKYYEGHERMIIVNSLEISAQGDDCTGKLALKIYSVEKDKDDYKYKAGKGETRESPFK